jgi:hypothetical protein
MMFLTNYRETEASAVDEEEEAIFILPSTPSKSTNAAAAK